MIVRLSLPHHTRKALFQVIGWLMMLCAQRADWDKVLAGKLGWLYNGSNFVDYFAPHPPLLMTSYDLDGHQMAQV